MFTPAPPPTLLGLPLQTSPSLCSVSRREGEKRGGDGRGGEKRGGEGRGEEGRCVIQGECEVSQGECEVSQGDIHGLILELTPSHHTHMHMCIRVM